ncbi:hypothetical protein GCM10025859_55310 [Alicyclobacillus fastidiosus]|nr:hypothetical protein GCM10025859_55310 [Alicyclobacillus fastidiosus]
MDPFNGGIFLLEDYDLDIARSLVQGVDVWLNTPLKPMEASGTSGQKAGLNGVMNCSIRDGWWDEGVSSLNGWAIPDSSEVSPQKRDEADSQALYNILEDAIIPLYYTRDLGRVPRRWVDCMRESIRTITPLFSSQRMLRQYDEQIYQPTIKRGGRLAENHFALASQIAEFKHFICENWSSVRVLSVDFREGREPFSEYRYGLGEGMIHSEVLVEVYLGAVWFQDVRVEAVGSNGMGGIWRCSLSFAAKVRQGVYLYRGFFHGTEEKWRQSNANVRVFPSSINFASEFELELAKWADPNG